MMTSPFTQAMVASCTPAGGPVFRGYSPLVIAIERPGNRSAWPGVQVDLAGRIYRCRNDRCCTTADDHSTAIGMALCLASSVLGRVTVRTPFLKLALILSGATAAGSRTMRENAP